jgi:putative peptidoglycan lipid II flippase
MGVAGLAVAVVGGSAGHLLVQLRPLRRLGLRFSPGIRLADPAARKALLLMAPRAIGLGGAQVTFLVMTTLASTLPTGSIAGFNFAFTILQIPIGIIGVPLGIVLLPSLSREIALGDLARFRSLLVRAIRLLGVVTIGLAGLGIVLADEAVVLLFGYGAIAPSALGPTAAALVAFLIGLPAHALIALLARAFYARQDTLTPVLAALASVLVNVAVGVAAVGPLGLTGLALAIAIGAWLEVIALALVLWRRIPGLPVGGVLRVLALASLASAGAAGVAFGVEQLAIGAWGPAPDDRLALVARTSLSAVAGGAAFLGLAFALRIREVPTIVALMTDLLRRPRAT